MVWTLFSLKYIRKYKMDVWELGPRGRNGYYAWPSHREKKRGEEKKGKRKGCPSLGKGEGTRFFLAFYLLAKQQNSSLCAAMDCGTLHSFPHSVHICKGVVIKWMIIDRFLLLKCM